ncbi:hypothetical protein CSHISOI_04370 [Colletotrichum shisoi]|uniref:Uncharacterized protein n=1 Tax=Colletotrichum shisoi TaxID=2078593 RepID=A0A5Q4BVQ5_9PEZI|nr:hypothetical protein CSHISOI_04370 [Colletotrichum shisoi]
MAGLQPGAGTPLGASSSAPLPGPVLGVDRSEAGGTNRPIAAIIIIVCAAGEAKHADSLTETDAITTTTTTTTTRALELRPPSHDVPPPPPPSATSLPVVVLPSSPPAALTPSPTPSFIPPPPPAIPESSPPLTPTPTPTPTPLPGGIASPSQAETSGGGNVVKLMPALPIALGSVGGVFIFGLIIGVLYRKGRWPFHRRRHFAEIDELEVERQQELERQNKMKWDPRVTRAYRTQDAGVNF